MTPKPGYLTTEFWVAIFAQGAAVVAAFQGLLDGIDFAILSGAVSSFYSLARGITKKKA